MGTFLALFTLTRFAAGTGACDPTGPHWAAASKPTVDRFLRPPQSGRWGNGIPGPSPGLGLATSLLSRRLGLPAVLPAYAFGLRFICQGFGHSGASVGLHAFVLDIAPPAERPSYIGSVNTILGIVSFIPIIGGTLIDFLGYEVVFALAFIWPRFWYPGD